MFWGPRAGFVIKYKYQVDHILLLGVSFAVDLPLMLPDTFSKLLDDRLLEPCLGPHLQDLEINPTCDP